MLLPNRDRAAIDERKVADYSLSPSHPDNGGKAAFFHRWGFSRAAVDVLERAIRDMISRTAVTWQFRSAWGEKYVIDGSLDSPRGMTPPVRTVWIIDAANSAPRLATAYPAGKV